MTSNSFLSSLPAILGLTGFAIVALLRHNSRGDATTRQILDKVRREAPEIAKRFEGLKGKQLDDAVLRDQSIQRILTTEDNALLRQALSQQFKLSLYAYFIFACLFVFGLIMFLRQESLPSEPKTGGSGLENQPPLSHVQATPSPIPSMIFNNGGNNPGGNNTFDGPIVQGVDNQVGVTPPKTEEPKQTRPK